MWESRYLTKSLVKATNEKKIQISMQSVCGIFIETLLKNIAHNLCWFSPPGNVRKP